MPCKLSTDTANLQDSGMRPETAALMPLLFVLCPTRLRGLVPCVLVQHKPSEEPHEAKIAASIPLFVYTYVPQAMLKAAHALTVLTLSSRQGLHLKDKLHAMFTPQTSMTDAHGHIVFNGVVKMILSHCSMVCSAMHRVHEAAVENKAGHIGMRHDDIGQGVVLQNHRICTDLL